MGRPSSYTPEIAAEICERLAGGESLLSICSEDPMPPQSVVFNWLHAQPTFMENYARARQFWAECEFERMMNIADTPQMGEKTEETEGKLKVITGDMIDHRRLQVETRKWALARQSPRRYGDATLLKHADNEGNEFVVRVERIGDKSGK